MAGKFKRKPFSEINLNDSFFDSLKADYPGTATSKAFSVWFSQKAAEGKKLWSLKTIRESVLSLISNMAKLKKFVYKMVRLCRRIPVSK